MSVHATSNTAPAQIRNATILLSKRALRILTLHVANPRRPTEIPGGSVTCPEQSWAGGVLYRAPSAAALTALRAFTIPPLTDKERKLTFSCVPGLLTVVVGLKDDLMIMSLT